MLQPLEIKQLTPDLIGDWLGFFEGGAFSDNPAWSSCYCYFYHADHRQRPWQERSREENREQAIDLIRAGKLEGFLAYRGDRILGWCHAAPRLLIPNLQRESNLMVENIDQIGAVVCFLVHPQHRRQGIAHQLLVGALENFLQRGLLLAEAYPRKFADDDSSHYHGPRSLYEKVGFTLYREMENLLIMRKWLRE